MEQGQLSARGVGLALCASALVACGGGAATGIAPHETTPAGAGTGATTTEAAPLDAHRALLAFAGRYPTHEFQQTANDCGTQFQNNVTFIVVDADAQVLYTEGEARHYDARVEDGELVADAWFGAQHDSALCEGSQFNERWRFRKRPDGGLTGAVEGLWPLAPNHCQHACRVRFTVETSPSTGEAHAPPRPAAPRPDMIEED